ncbi:Fe-S-containing protein [Ruminococcus sp.]|uniref:Fe-S-containing protein n=1 Tax=Ruminococcus sp. TaxID=41978 RepID=UPI0025F83A3C|nr:Fe-S-containing protein [Ruminococcus sp.]MBQ8966080.1 DUF2318 domain-containing protein [Ruminococcus sp.]
MFKYFVMTVEALVTAAVMTGVLRGFLRLISERFGKSCGSVGALAGIAAAAVMSYMKNATTLIDTSLWNLRIFTVTIILSLLLVIFSIFRSKKVMGGISCVMGALIIALIIFYALPDVLAYPYLILLTEKSVLSTGFLLKCIGILLGLLTMIVAQMAIHNGTLRLGPWQAWGVTAAVLVINAARQFCASLGIMLNKRMLENFDADTKHNVFELVKFSSNNSNIFIYGAIIVMLVMPVILWIKSLRADEPYDNPAQKRKIRKKWRVTRIWATLGAICLIFGMVTFTTLHEIANREIPLSPVEDAKIEDGYVIVPFEQVDDGHLHRFAYVTENDIQIRFIVIKKPDSSAYGIGLDACDVCGETGYFEKDGQVVCKLCDVVMNIQTIGFKGGCNPVVIPYEIKDGRIMVPLEGLLENEKRFKNNRMRS